MTINIHKTGFWDYNDSDHDESIHLDLGLSNFLVEFSKQQKINCIIDFGCSTGYYLSFFESVLKKTELIGVEGKIMSSKNLKFNNIIEHDLSKEFNLNKKGAIMCLEVIEHIPKEYEKTVLNNIKKHSEKYVFMSWAQPNQGGLGHVNEVDVNEVIKKFEFMGFKFLLDETQKARESASLPWIKKNFCIFEKI
jgi:hypothetical protein